ncbi:MAG: hypothetical protein H0T42_00675 [Deltaproteobacteria bacterium]|nr:hypothetical protein [Deltaproteobacteria bacterium]
MSVARLALLAVVVACANPRVVMSPEQGARIGTIELGWSRAEVNDELGP